jgi:multicomponent Na+:H+ antiporter subunit F
MIHGDSGLVATTASVVLVVLTVAVFLAFTRLIRGPSLPDRAVALELSGTLVVGIIAAYAMLTLQPVLLDVAIALALVSFLGSVAIARYIEKGDSS